VQKAARPRTLAPISIEGGLTVCARDWAGKCLARLIYDTPEEAARSFLDLRERIIRAADETALCLAMDEWVKSEERRNAKPTDGKPKRTFLDRMLALDKDEKDGDFL
jgi:hypothetical protein